jgi:hypothetical protein
VSRRIVGVRFAGVCAVSVSLWPGLRAVGARLTGSLADRAAPGFADPDEARRVAALPARIAEELSARSSEPFELLGSETTRTGSLVARFGGRRACIAKAALRPTTAPRLRANLEALETLSAAAWMAAPFDRYLSQPIASFEVDDAFCTVETLLPGRSACRRSRRRTTYGA